MHSLIPPRQPDAAVRVTWSLEVALIAATVRTRAALAFSTIAERRVPRFGLPAIGRPAIAAIRGLVGLHDSPFCSPRDSGSIGEWPGSG